MCGILVSFKLERALPTFESFLYSCKRFSLRTSVPKSKGQSINSIVFIMLYRNNPNPASFKQVKDPPTYLHSPLTWPIESDDHRCFQPGVRDQSFNVKTSQRDEMFNLGKMSFFRLSFFFFNLSPPT